jgi:hypothetical protein
VFLKTKATETAFQSIFNQFWKPPLSSADSTQDQPNPLRRPTIWWVFFVALCASVLRLYPASVGPPTLIGAVYISSSMTLFAAIGIWLGVGNVWWRYPIQIAATFAVVLLLASTGPMDLQSLLVMGFFGGLIIGVVAFPIFLFRFLRNGRLSKPSPDDVTVKEALQFGVIHLLGLMTGVAILVALGQWLFPLLISSGGNLILICKLGLTISLGTLIAVWATLGNHPLLRTGVSVLAIAGLACFNYFFIMQNPFQWIYPAVTLIVWIQITVLFWCLRLEGYRFIRRPRTDSI